MEHIKSFTIGAIIASSTLTLGMNKLTNKVEKYENEESKCTCIPVKKNKSTFKNKDKKETTFIQRCRSKGCWHTRHLGNKNFINKERSSYGSYKNGNEQTSNSGEG